jgi:Cu-Zn family superoxide dismutase
MNSRVGCWSVLAAGASLAFACAGDRAASGQPGGTPGAEAAAVGQAVAVLHATAANQAKGVVHFTREGDALRVSVHIEGLTPGEHGFHVHEFGDCSAPDATSAGGHFDPFREPHGARNAAKRHVGDLGNVVANATGVVDADFTDSRIALPGRVPQGSASILGRAVIVHGGRDDLTSQPSGAAGPRVACGVIGVAAAPKATQ